MAPNRSTTGRASSEPVPRGLLAAELRRFRIAAGLTQEELAERAGISVRAVSDTERGMRTRVYAATAARLASALDLNGPEAARFTRLARGLSLGGLRGPQNGTAGWLAPLPDPRTPLLGREAAVRQLTEALTDPARRLTTLTGPGGVGKTRLALAAARACAWAFDDGVAFVQLASCRDPEAVALAIATAVGGNVAHGTIEDVACAAIGERRILLLCDTFEGVATAAPLLGTVLDRCPDTVILVTSRVPLRLTAENLLPVEPLDPIAARSLFLQRAMVARPGVDLSASGPLVDDICARVQRVPLAVELASARVAHLGLEDLAGRLNHQLGVLVGGPVDQTARHRTIEATVEWSYGLLDESARQALALLSVFDCWSLAGAREVLGRDPLPDVGRLIDHSLVLAPSPTDMAARYRMLDVVREYGEARLEHAHARSAARDRHASWFLRASRAEAMAIRNTGQRRAHEELSADLGNLRLAFTWLLEAGRATDALGLAASLWMFWLWQGGLSEGRAWLRTALAAAEAARSTQQPAGATETTLLSRARSGAGMLAYLQGDYAEARIHAGVLRQLAQRGGPLEQRNALTMGGMMALADRRLEETSSLFRQALTVARELPDDRWLLAISTLNDGVGPTHTGRLEEANDCFAMARDMFAELGDETYRARALRHLASVRLLADNPGPALDLLAQSESIVTAAADRGGLAETFEDRAHVAARAGHPRQAGVLAARAAVLLRSLGLAGHPFDVILAERYLGPLRGTGAFEAGWREGSVQSEPGQ